jgi:hypothetical protein
LLGQVTGGAGGSVANKGQPIPLLIQGTTSDPKFGPAVSGLAAEMLKSQLGNLSHPGATSQQQPNTNTNNPLDALSGLRKTAKLMSPLDGQSS